MTCPEERVVAFLAGDLSAEEECEFDHHLLECERCWREVQADRAGRLALQRLRESAPAGLGDRVSFAISLEVSHGAARRWRLRLRADHRHGVLRLAAVLLVVLAVGGALGELFATGASTDPPQVAAVVAMVSSNGHASATLLGGERRVVDRQQMTVRAYMIHNKEVLVATSLTPLPMPATSHLLAGSSLRAWMATDGTLALYGVNRPAGKPSMFVLAAMPMAALPQLAARLHLI